MEREMKKKRYTTEENIKQGTLHVFKGFQSKRRNNS